ncbi:PREDICTED: delta(3,5)-Delta(2,4)-dienoyl-CoA isomerase, mitochondrial isoform X2 [Ceratosolen solmsi marchali]|uniref:Delta(3,5)-Delta(2,4)-dienoyl-CoA isomerase, mitochondrial n=1 Tax=Ceratosolen solmsi marchali TaxID=326594 RepID=A0AAJ7DV64_9HYME|nr:PREDICTED: delta(3,5)-Delta(2,4)-dienoyl-CoA isomerase, mitochondrial isoform X1 [Ceratosolen solmsi marchali]XP_011497598.1 PREDICTED: delta(3,5)-Delta(2,4)-dienoyl-CoA isomerase, mitochondrial isoform X2 [Ceratosolen solmsi marchali]
MEQKNYTTLAITEPSPSVFHVQLNRSNKLNALNGTMWLEIGECFNELSNKSDCRVIILSGSGKAFCAGIDLMDAMKLFQELVELPDVARKCKVLEKKIKQYQDSFTAIEQCSKPVITAVHGACVGGGVDMICSADIRYCSSDAWFQIKEVDLGMAADVGTLQRLPKIIGSQSLVNELAYTGRKMLSSEALQIGFVSQILDDKTSLMDKALDVAKEIAAKSPVAVQGTKLSLNYSREHTVGEGLNHILMRNQIMLQSEDFINAATALATKGDKPVFSKL